MYTDRTEDVVMRNELEEGKEVGMSSIGSLVPPPETLESPLGGPFDKSINSPSVDVREYSYVPFNDL